MDEWVTGDDEAAQDLPDVTPVVQMLAGFREVLERRAIGLASRLYAEPPARYAERLGSYWETWTVLGDELGAGEIGDVWPDQ